MEAVGNQLFGAATINVSLFRTLGDGTRHSEPNLPTTALMPLCDLTNDRVSVHVEFTKKNAKGYVEERLTARFRGDEYGYIDLELSANDAEKVRDFEKAFAKELNLATAPNPTTRMDERFEAARKEKQNEKTPTDKALDELRVRIQALERTNAAESPITCFLSYQFTGKSLEYARQVKHYLGLLGVTVITGQGYEPKPIAEKVRARLSEKLDLVVVIEVAERKSSWTRDEMARAQTPGVFLIPLIEQGAKFDQGIYGDHEFISFAPDHVSDAFAGLLEGVLYIKRVRTSTTQNGNGESKTAG